MFRTPQHLCEFGLPSQVLFPPAHEKCKMSGENGVCVCQFNPPHIHTHRHTPTDQFVHCKGAVSVPTAGADVPSYGQSQGEETA